jgi:hypothetical protein
MFNVKRVDGSSLVGRPVRLPITAVLVVPDNPYLNDAHVFNLPGAIDDLMGSAGWPRAVKVLQPRIWAPEWSKKRFQEFASKPSPEKKRRLPESEIRRLRLKDFPPMGHGPVDLEREWPEYEIVHVVSDFAPAGLSQEPVFRLQMSRRGPLKSDFASGRVIPAGRLRDILIALRTRLLILQVAHFSAEAAGDLASRIVNAGGPSTAVVSGATPESLDRYFTDLYARIIHNQPLQIVVEPADPSGPNVQLILNTHGDYALQLTPFFDELARKIDDVKLADRRVIERFAQDNVKLLHTSQLDRLRFKVRTIALKDKRSRAVLEDLPRLNDLSDKINWARESGGALPTAEIAEAEPELQRTLDELTDVHLRYPQLENELRADLDDMARRAPRVLNATFADPAKNSLIEQYEVLRENTRYDLLVDVGPRWSHIRSLVAGNAAFPENALPPNKDGHLIRVMFFSDDFLAVGEAQEEPQELPTPALAATQTSTFEAADVPPLEDTLPPTKVAYRSPVATGEIWLPSGTGRSFPVVRGQRSRESGPVRLQVTTKSFPTEPTQATEASGRLSLYYENNLIQSAAVRVQIGTDKNRTGKDNSIDVDFALSGSFVDLGQHATRELETGKERKRYGVGVNIALNDDAAGGHRIMIANHAELAAFRPYDPKAAEDLLQISRDKLKEIFSKRDPASCAVTPQLRNQDALDGDNAKDLRQFKCDLYQLAWYGSDLFAYAFGQIAVPNQNAYIRKLRQALASRTVIQVVRTIAQYVYPWAMVYDIPLPNKEQGKLRWCKVLSEWSGPRAKRDLEAAEQCPFHDEPEHQQDMLCPYGFWGLKHFIEQPINVMPAPAAENRSPTVVPDASSTIELPNPITFGLGVTRDAVLDAKAIKKHLDSVRGVVKAFTPANGADDWTHVQNMLQQPDIVYFLCHGDIDAQKRPFLGIGPRDNDPAHRIYAEALFQWSNTQNFDDTWMARRPLIFINGCHTTNLKPGEILSFVATFAGFGASAVIGTEISVRLPLAAEIGEKFIAGVLKGEAVGAIIHRLRWELANKGNLLGLAYTPYCLSNLRLHSA